MEMKFSIIGVEGVSKIVDALTSLQSNYEIKITTDEYQSFKDSNERAFTVSLADMDNVERFELVTMENEEIFFDTLRRISYLIEGNEDAEEIEKLIEEIKELRY